MPLIFFLVVVWGLYNAAVEGSARAAARPKSGRAGLSNYLDEVWHGFWEQKATGLAAARSAKATGPGQRVRWSDRWSSAKSAMAAAKGKATVVARKLIDPIELKPKPTTDGDDAMPRNGDVRQGPNGPERFDGTTWSRLTGDWGNRRDETAKDGDERYGGTGPERFDAATNAWWPIPQQKPAPAAPAARQGSLNSSTEGAPDMTTPAQAAAPANPNTGPTGEAVGVVGGAAQAQQIKLAVIALKERTLAQIAALQKSTETLSASAASMEIDPKTAGEIARAQEALAALSAAMTGTAEEVCASMKGVEDGFSKHLPGVEFNAAVGGMANRPAYSGN